MRAIRQILYDKVLATALTVVLAYVLVLQGLTGGYARASMLEPAQSAYHVICASSGTVDIKSADSDAPLSKSVECSCAMLCRLANSTTPTALPSFVFFTVMMTQTSAIITPVDDTAKPHLQRRLLAQPRAPPRLSRTV